MQIKRFEAKDMPQALKLVKRELGSEAVILSARSFINKKGLLGSFKKRGVEVTAAVDTQYRGSDKNLQNIRSDPYRCKYPIRSCDHHLPKDPKSFDPPARPVRPLRYRAGAADAAYGLLSHKSEARHPLYVPLISQGLHEDLVTELISELIPAVSPDQTPKNGLIRKYLINFLEQKGVSTGPLKLEKNTCKIAAFIGQPGVGKTTTVAKLTAEQTLERNKRVTLFTIDSHRIAAVEQLGIYAKMIRVPLEMPFNPRDLDKALVKHKNQDLILIDTPGIGLKDEKGLDRIKQLADMIPFIEIHLLLSATTKEQDLIEIFERLKSIPVNRLIFSKLDESICHGNLINQLVRTRIPVSYLTNGQAVPESIESASLEKIADLISLDGPKNNKLYDPINAPLHKNDRRHFYNYNSADYFIANQNSDIYHVPNCKWNKMIKEENIIIFDSVAEADRKMFKPCRSCSPDTITRNHPSVRATDKRHLVRSKA
jgi:flagellar biosynthesis protein FlhF